MFNNIFWYKVDPWVTKNGCYPLPSEEENCHLVEVTEEDVAQVITSIPKLDTLILIKHMLRKHSFQVSQSIYFSNDQFFLSIGRSGLQKEIAIYPMCKVSTIKV